MRQYTYTDGDKTYTRISKAKARAVYNAGLEVALCPVNIRPGAPWYPEIHVSKERSEGESFDNVLNTFEFYNTRNTETGYYTAFYIPVHPVDRFSGEPCNPDSAGAILEYDYKEGVEA
jgi:hypothetical protein